MEAASSVTAEAGEVQVGGSEKELTWGTRGRTQELHGKEEISLETGTCSPLTS